MSTERLALYTSVYPGVEPYLAEWGRSVGAQTDQDFDLWFGVDQLSQAAVEQALAETLPVDCRLCWSIAEPGATSSQVRQQAITQIVAAYPAVVFVDSDDILYTERIAAARSQLAQYDAVACALCIIDEQSNDLDLTFAPDPQDDIVAVLPRYNSFGLSNSAYRCDLLRQCLPLTPTNPLVDWVFATRAWALGARLAFDQEPRMAYRQYARNIAHVLGPFSARQVVYATERVRLHYASELAGWSYPLHQRAALLAAQAEVEQFYRFITAADANLEQYITALNQLQPKYVWWWAIAHPDLEELWKP
jgi:tRNA nucleotidyltransferase/poly(A) polymerase